LKCGIARCPAFRKDVSAALAEARAKKSMFEDNCAGAVSAISSLGVGDGNTATPEGLLFALALL